MRFFERPDGFVELIIPYSVRHYKHQCGAVDTYRCILIRFNNGSFYAITLAEFCDKVNSRNIFEIHSVLLSSNILSMLFSR